ncbi:MULTISPECIES: NAD(P)H-dependent oxidoreductase [unclassified Marinobacter]|jgi:NAD(P)H-dependent FMN reductase|uniref:NADPH-dependent FMN reductase n=1 Tax=unclassified Marinobacter TaxID=83889 RepID=UPI00200D5A2D|nr:MULTISPECIES: NAD(P)H-dependent oxidoreductase [unclassified Marinobacter]MCL1480682.1 NAD(P)H-dependent oxidoreductase [Marinobacter sp.]MCL1484907.1 NAD(P)H-dependent oxidoreductase [Marinobacter sp.]UQG56435.1 NAD(P)H-dependent oxidoreductase [Marinobacter sp. M4C]UQG65239.1 NAD(P)H-dependent oxidoreductase [Marinobacter sp. M2C]UQG69518.1 NAD(P)H-dependent oxidoreductase [Marinobacter sp. M1C]
MALTLNIVTCSTRPGRIGPSIAQWFLEYAREHSAFDCRLVDLVDFELPVYNEANHPKSGIYEHEHTRRWAASVSSADAFVFVLPEYNFCPPPSFVNALNYVYTEWNYKPCGFVSYGGAGGGVRAALLARQLVTTLKMMPMVEGVMVPMAWNQIDDNKVFHSNELIDPSATDLLVELEKWAKGLKAMR